MQDNYVISRILGSTKYFLLFVLIIGVFFGSGIGISIFIASRAEDRTTIIPTDPNLSTTTTTSLGPSAEQTLTVNSQLQVNGLLSLTPTAAPSQAKAGTLYFDQDTQTLQYYNGTNFVPVASQDAIPQNSVLTVQGQSGVVTFTAGQGININGTTISATGGGLTAISGTLGQVTVVTNANGVATISLPQSITPTAIPTFAGLTLSSALGVPYGGTGQTNFTANSVLLGNGTGPLNQASPSGLGTLCLISISGATPAFQVCPGAGSGAGVTVGSAGTTNVLPKFSGPSEIVDSSISDNGTLVQINNPLSVTGNLTAAVLQSTGTLTVTPGGTFSLGALNQQFTFSGSATSSIVVQSGPNTTTLGFASPSSAVTVTVPDETGTICLRNSPACGFATSGSGVSAVNSQVGSVTINNASGSSGSVTINDASTASKGIAQFNGTNFSTSLGVVNTAQNIATTSSPQFAGLVITGTLSVNTIAQTAPGQAVTVTAGSDGITFTANGRDFIFPNTGPGSQTICTTGISCVAGGGQAVLLAPGSAQTDNTTDVSLFIDKTNTGNLIQLQNSGVNRLILSGAGTLSVNALESISGALTIGVTANQTIFQGTTASEFRIGSVIYRFDASAVGGPYNICTTANNCSGLTGAVTTPGGTIGRLPKFTTSQEVQDSLLSESGSVLTVNNGSLVVQGSAGLVLGVSSGVNGRIDLRNSTNANIVTLQSGATAASFSLTLPVSDGIANQCIKTNGSGQLTFGDCLTGSGGGGGVTSLNGNSGSVTIQGTANQVSVTGSGINPIILSLPQNIATSSSPTFSTLTLSGTAGAGLSVGGIGAAGRIVLSDGDATPQNVTFLPATLSADKIITIPNFTGATATLPVTASGFIQITAAGDITTTGVLGVGSGGTGGSTPAAARTGIGAAASGSNSDITATTVLNTITPSGALTIGATGQTYILQGNGSSSLRATSGSFTTTVGFITPTANRSINFPDLGGTVCTTAGNCIGSGSGASAAATFITVNDETASLPNSQILTGVGNITISTNGSNREIATVSSPSFSGTLTATTQVITNSLSLNGSVVSNIAGTGLQLSGGALQATLGTSIETAEITNGTILFEDLNANSCVADQVIKRNPGNTAWVCGTDSAGSGTNTFATIAVPDGNNSVAGSTTDTLTFINGSGITITGNTGAKSVTITSTLGTSVDLASEVTGTLPVNRGGTGTTSLTTNGVLFGNGTSAVGSTAAGTTGQCLTANTGSAPTWGSCGSGASTLQQAYDGDPDGGGAVIALTVADGGIFIRDTAGGLSPAFAIQNSGGTVNYLGVSATSTTLQDTSGNFAFEFNTSSSELRVYENVASPTRYLRMYYDTANNVAVYGASTGATQIGTGVGTGGDINFLLNGAATDKFTGTKSFTLTSAYSGTDFNFVRNLTGTTFNISGNVAKIEDISSTTSGVISPNVLYINQNNAGASGNLILAQTGGAVDRFRVATTGTVTIAAGASYTGTGALTVSSATNFDLNLRADGTGRIVLGTSDTTGTILVLDTKTNTGDPAGTAGAMYYNSAMNSFRCYEGSAWRNCLSGIIRTAAGRTTLSTTYVDVPDMTYAVDASRSYTFRCTLSFSSTNATNGFAFSINGPSFSILSYTTSYQTTANATASTTLFTTRHDTAYNAMTTTTSTISAGTNLAASVEGTFTTTAAGTFALRYLSETNTDSITINQGSSCAIN
jgi:hypothetical protein